MSAVNDTANNRNSGSIILNAIFLRTLFERKESTGNILAYAQGRECLDTRSVESEQGCEVILSFPQSKLGFKSISVRSLSLLCSFFVQNPVTHI